MPRSYQLLNFRLRPAKHIERKMIVDELRKLNSLFPLEQYRYVGFGANTFADFILCHRQLGIRDMVSIEEADTDAERFELNKPFAAIRMEYGLSSAILPQIAWDPPTIIWLDYDEQIDGAKIADVELVAGSAAGGSALLVTVSGEPEHSFATVLDELRESVGADRVPIEVDAASLEGWGFARASRRILVEAISRTLSDRNQGLASEQQLTFHQFANFEYADGMRMVTVGGVFVRDDQDALLRASGICDVDWYRPGDHPFRIKTPQLTLREMRFLDAQLPADTSALARSGIPERDVTSYAAVYRFYPNYVDADM